MTEEKSDIENQVNNTEPMETDKEEDTTKKDEAKPDAELKEKKEEDKNGGDEEEEKENQEEEEEKEKPDAEIKKKEEKKPANSPKKTPTKKEKPKEEEEEEEDDEEEEESEEEEQKLGLFDQPLEVSGSRERKKVQRLDVSFTATTDKQPEIPEGKGEKLGDCPRIEFFIQKTHSDNLKPLHKLLYKRLGSGAEIKKNIRKFSGFTFEKDSSEYQKKKAILEKMSLAVLKGMCDVLDLERSYPKEELINRMMDFLLKPAPSGKQLPKKKSKGGKKGRKAKTSTATAAANSASEDDNEEEEENDQKNGSNESEEEEASEDKSEEDEAKKKKKRAPRKKAAEKKTPAKRKAAPKRGRASKKSKLEVEEAADDSEADDKEESEEEEEKTKKPPTDDEIVDLIKKILEGANLEEITMKKVIKEVFEKFPDHDLGEKKEFIKTTVRSLIS